MSIRGTGCSTTQHLEEALRELQQRLEQHLEHEKRLVRLCQGWQQRWSGQVDALQKRLARLEAYLSAWLNEPAVTPPQATVYTPAAGTPVHAPRPQLAVVGASEQDAA